jgi:hypothetical protein
MRVCAWSAFRFGNIASPSWVISFCACWLAKDSINQEDRDAESGGQVIRAHEPRIPHRGTLPLIHTCTRRQLRDLPAGRALRERAATNP